MMFKSSLLAPIRSGLKGKFPRKTRRVVSYVHDLNALKHIKHMTPAFALVVEDLAERSKHSPQSKTVKAIKLAPTMVLK